MQNYLFKVFPNDLEIKKGSTPAFFTVKTSQAYPPQDSFNDLIIWKMNLNRLVVPVTSVKFKSAFLHV